MTRSSVADADVSAFTEQEWFHWIDEVGDEAGYFQPLGDDHAAFFLDEGPTLLVTFETVAAIRTPERGQLPLGYRIARARKWSHLCLIARTDSWYRDGAVFAYFDRLVDDGFFEDFDRVVFYGAGMGGYAAAAFSVTAPGATVIAIQPQATLDPQVTGWDTRHRAMRRISFTDRYGYAPRMIDGAGPVYIIYDPKVRLDAMHAALFTKPFVTMLPCPNMGPYLERSLLEMRVLQPLLTAACEGRFDPEIFHLYRRARRNYPPYLRGLIDRLEAAGRIYLAAVVCRNVVARLNGPRFRGRLDRLEEQLAQSGHALPPPLGERA